MLRHAIAPVRRYTKVSHDVMRHPRLGSDAKVMIAYAQGLPDERAGKALSELAREVGITGRKFQIAKGQLVVNGFVHEWRVVGERGRWATQQLFSNVPLSDDEARAVWREAGAEVEPSPSERLPTVGQPGTRTVGHQLPVDEERVENSSRPPTEAGVEVPAGEPGSGELSGEDAVVERVLLSLRDVRADLRLGVVEARALVAQAVEWLRRGVSGVELRRVLSSDLPPGRVRSAVGFLRHRLEHKMPEAPRSREERGEGAAALAESSSAAADSASDADTGADAGSDADAGADSGAVTPYVPPPLVTCEGPGTEHVFRSWGGEELCPDCQQAAAWARWAERRAADLGVDLAEEAAAAVEAGRDPNGWRGRLAAAAAAHGVSESADER
ncbi:MULTISPECIES: hypothetical protein [Streptomyces]|uniref:hypothetical protein n=1 Tax=Streptomyces TaxID=1883 RepID=UPI00103E4F96|nr:MULTISPECIES: hypothetical protein [Streptomyces]MBT3077082.1 hypothetical protein [Streptomyces sp. COG21]MBT3082397.1 hypothetical protein [Streptomyces sp. COG20]MBT3090161.1 hypothetical protein [Streptomyces sp. CYG21]MBT3097177.1 hypothetical protein [Streptomyces sp. CBG30]MBT3104371.1 hypothetical protein [Streptomyces sp. COG19]